MKIWGIGLASLFLLSSGAGLAAEEEKVAVNANLGVFNRYVFRGYQIGQDSVVFQPSLAASYKGFSAGFWGNIDSDEHATQNFTPDRPGHKSFNETDLALSYTYPLGKLELTGGYIYYGTKYTAETEEFYLSLSYNTFGKPTLTVYRDITSYPGTYINLSLAQSWKVFKEVTLDLGASSAYFWGDSGYWKTYESSTGAYTGQKYQAFHDGMVKAGVTIPLVKNVAAQPMIQYWFPLSSQAERTVDGRSYNPNGSLDDSFVYGISLSYTY